VALGRRRAEETGTAHGKTVTRLGGCSGGARQGDDGQTALDRGTPGQRGGTAMMAAKACQLLIGPEHCSGVRTEPVRAPDHGGPWRSEQRFYACVCGDGRTPPRSANWGTTRGG
jgi:hypothetical protein